MELFRKKIIEEISSTKKNNIAKILIKKYKYIFYNSNIKYILINLY